MFFSLLFFGFYLFLAIIGGFQSISSVLMLGLVLTYLVFAIHDFFSTSFFSNIQIDGQIIMQRHILKPLRFQPDTEVELEKAAIRVGMIEFQHEQMNDWGQLVGFFTDAEKAGFIKIARKEPKKGSKGLVALTIIGFIVLVFVIPTGLLIASPYLLPSWQDHSVLPILCWFALLAGFIIYRKMRSHRKQRHN
jgi:hypothetical protein